MISSSGNGARGWGLKTLYMFAVLVGVGTALNYWLLPEVSFSVVIMLIPRLKAGPSRNSTKCTTREFLRGR
jgi:hypothetical protein